MIGVELIKESNMSPRLYKVEAVGADYRMMDDVELEIENARSQPLRLNVMLLPEGLGSAAVATNRRRGPQNPASQSCPQLQRA